MSEHVVVLCSVPDDEVAERLARELVEHRLAACVNVISGVRSIYRWQDGVEDAQERLLVVKTRLERFDAVRQRLAELHPYDVPEILALPVVAGHAPYLGWLDESV